MKSLLITLGLLFSLTAHAAVPSYQAFKGTNGIIVRTNPPTGDVIIDGAAISAGSPSPLSSTNFSTNTFLFSSNKVFSRGAHGKDEVFDRYDREVAMGSGLAGLTSSGHQLRPAGDTNALVISGGKFYTGAATNTAIYLSISNTMDAVAIEKAYTKIGGKISFRNQGGSSGFADVLSVILSDTTLENGLSGNFLHVVISWLGITVQRNLGSIILQESWTLDPSATPGKVFDFEMIIVSNSLFVACGPHKFSARASDLNTYRIKPVVTWEVFGSTTNQFVGAWHSSYAGYADAVMMIFDGRNGPLESNGLMRIISPFPITSSNATSGAYISFDDDSLVGTDGFQIGVSGGSAGIGFDNLNNVIFPIANPRTSLGDPLAPFNNVQATNFIAKKTVTLGGVTPARPGYISGAGDLTNASGTANGQNVMLDTGALTAISNKVVVAAGTGGITVTPSGAGGIMTFTVSDDDAGSGTPSPLLIHSYSSNNTTHAFRNSDGLITVYGTNQVWHINSGDTNMMLHFDTPVLNVEYAIHLTNGASSLVLSNGSAGMWKWKGQRPDSNGPPLLTNGFFKIIVRNFGGYTNAWLDMGPGFDLVPGSNITFTTNAAGTTVTVAATGGGGDTNFVVSSHGTIFVTNALRFGAADTYRAQDTGGFFQLFNPVSSVASLTVQESTDAVIIGAAGATPTVSFQAPVHVASNFFAKTVTSTNLLDAGSMTNRGSYGGAGTLFAHQLWETNIANVRQYGAVGDDTTDDTIALSNAFRNPIVYVPSGKYRTDPLTFSGLKIFGDGNVSSKIVSRSNIIGTIVVSINSTSAILENLWIGGTNNAGGVPNFNQSSSPTAVIGVKFNTAFGEGSVRNCRFTECFYGLWVVGTNSINPRYNSGNIYGNVFTNCNVGITTGSTNEAEFVQIENNTIIRCYRGFHNQSAANVLFLGNMIHDCNDAGIRVEPTTLSGSVRGHSFYQGNAVIHCTGGINLQRGFNATFVGNFLEGPITLASTTNAVFADNFWESTAITLAGGQANEFRDNRMTPASVTNMTGWDFYNCTFRGNKRSVNTKAGWEPMWDFSTVTLATNATEVFLDFAPWHPYRHIIIPASATNVSLWATNLDLVTHPHVEKTIRVTFTTNDTAMGSTRIQVTNLSVFPHRWTLLGEQTNGYPTLFKTNANELELTFRAKTTNHVQSIAEFFR